MRACVNGELVEWRKKMEGEDSNEDEVYLEMYGEGGESESYELPGSLGRELIRKRIGKLNIIKLISEVKEEERVVVDKVDYEEDKRAPPPPLDNDKRLSSVCIKEEINGKLPQNLKEKDVEKKAKPRRKDDKMNDFEREKGYGRGYPNFIGGLGLLGDYSDYLVQIQQQQVAVTGYHCCQQQIWSSLNGCAIPPVPLMSIPLQESGYRYRPQNVNRKHFKDKLISKKRHLIEMEPDIPFGVWFEGKYCGGENFEDFAVIPEIAETAYRLKQINKSVESCSKEKLNKFKVGALCIVNCRNDEGENWFRRAVIKKMVVGFNEITAYLLDFGQLVNVAVRDVFEMSNSLKKLSPAAVKVKCVNLKGDVNDSDVKYYFERLVKEKIVKIKVMGKVKNEDNLFGGIVKVCHLGNWFGVGCLLKKFLVGEGEDVSEDGIEKDKELISVVKRNFVLEEGLLERAVITHVASINEFYVATRESLKRKCGIESKLNDKDNQNGFKWVKTLKTLSHPILILVEDNNLYSRVKVLDVMGEGGDDDKMTVARVLKVDCGEEVIIPIKYLREAPDYLMEEPCCAFKCTLPVKVKPPSKNKGGKGGGAMIPLDFDKLKEFLKDLQRECVKVTVFLVEGDVHVVEVCKTGGKRGVSSYLLERGGLTLSHLVDLN